MTTSGVPPTGVYWWRKGCRVRPHPEDLRRAGEAGGLLDAPPADPDAVCEDCGLKRGIHVEGAGRYA